MVSERDVRRVLNRTPEQLARRQNERERWSKAFKERDEERDKANQRIRALIIEKAQPLGLKMLTEGPYVLVEQAHQPETLPNHFFIVRFKEGQPELEEHRINFPIDNLPQFQQTLESLDILYDTCTNPVLYDRHGVKGLRTFLENYQTTME